MPSLNRRPREFLSPVPALVGALVLGSTTSSISGAQDAPTDEADAPTYYHVELLVFQHLDQSRSSNEAWQAPEPEFPEELSITMPKDDSMPGDPGSVGVTTTIPPGSDGTGSDPIEFLLLDPAPPAPEFVQLVPQQFLLSDAAATLEEIEAYDPIIHIGWLQPAHSADEAAVYNLVLTESDPDVLDGTIKLYKQRFLHLELDLSFSESGSTEDDQQYGFWERMMPLARNPAPIYRIQQSRRLRTGTLQYFDHPRFGVIATVTEIVGEKPPEAENEAS